MERYLDDFINHISASNSSSEHTEIAYRNDVEQFIQYFKGVDLDDLNQDHAYEYIRSLHELKLSSASVARKISALRSFFLFLQQNYGITQNPFSHVQLSTRSRQLPQFLTHTEMDQLLLSCDNDVLGIRNQVMIELMYACGLRVSECVNLKVGDIDISERSINILGKGNKERVLFFYEDLLQKLQNYIYHVRPLLLKEKAHNNVFVNANGDPISDRGIAFILKEQGLKANLKQHLHPHVLRHTFATHLIDNGASIRIVQTLLGHESLSTTQIYTHVSLRLLKVSYEKAMDKLILT